MLRRTFLAGSGALLLAGCLYAQPKGGLETTQILVDDEIWEVTLDYFKRSDGVRLPVDLPMAWKLADSYGMTLPTAHVVDAIWQQADIKLPPAPLPASPRMTSEAYYERHNEIIEDQLAGRNTQGKLIAGHKKDLVWIERDSPKVAIYGWHYPNGRPIQKYSTVHGRNYADYSHGLRLVKRIS